MSNGFFMTPPPENEPIQSYGPSTVERRTLKAKLDSMAENPIDIPLIIGGKEIKTDRHVEVVSPHEHRRVLARCSQADAGHVAQAIEAAETAWRDWSRYPWQERAAVFLKAADLLAGPYRDVINASTMLGQSKTAHQSEIDAACELIDFYRFNVHYMTRIYADQPMFSPAPTWNRGEYRPLEGFVFAITPFNFTSIAGNLCASPAVMGNTVLWKPSETASLSGYYIMKLMEDAGLPPGVVNYVPGPPQEIGAAGLTHAKLAGVHFTGSTPTFQHIWRTLGENVQNYRAYPRIVGETGGKDFIVAHESADLQALAIALIRGAFEFQGQKCSAASRAYIPKNIWPEVKERMIEEIKTIRMGDIRDFSNFMGAVIDQRAYDKIKGYIDHARDSADAKVLWGGECDDRRGYFIPPTVVETPNPRFTTMCEEIFGPVLTVHPYEPDQFEETLALCDATSPYALTGAIFAQDRGVIIKANEALMHAAGNFYINDKPTGAVVGQQPFGGGRASGTNDKAGSQWNLLRWANARSVKENFAPPLDYRYPHMREP